MQSFSEGNHPAFKSPLGTRKSSAEEQIDEPGLTVEEEWLISRCGDSLSSLEQFRDCKRRGKRGILQ